MRKRISGTYGLAVDPAWRQVTLDEIYLECDTSSAPVTINLFEIAELNDFWNVKIYVSDISDNAETNNITINTGGSDEIDGDGNTSVVISSNGGAVALKVVSSTQWMGLESVSSGNATKKTIYKITGGDSFVFKELISGEDVFDWSLTNTSTRRMVVTYTGGGSLVANSGTIGLTPTTYQNEGWGGFVAFPMPIKVELASTSVQLLIGGWAFNGGATLVQAFPLLSRNDEFTQFYILEITYKD